jgi:hypothetical protein
MPVDHQEMIGRVAVMKPGIEECDGFLETGMRARITAIRRKEEDVFVFTFDVTGFDALNAPFETANYYDANGVARLTAREAGAWKPVDDYYLPGPSGWAEMFEIEAPDPARSAILKAFAGRNDPAQSYVAWLEAQLAAAVDAGHPLDAAAEMTPEFG